MTTWNVAAKRWTHGWELHISEEGTEIGVTQSRTLDGAERTVRDYIATMYDTDEVFSDVNIVPRARTHRRSRPEGETPQS